MFALVMCLEVSCDAWVACLLLSMLSVDPLVGGLVHLVRVFAGCCVRLVCLFGLSVCGMVCLFVNLFACLAGLRVCLLAWSIGRLVGWCLCLRDLSV